MLDFLQGLSVGSLLLFDLGYFSFNFFDTFDAEEPMVGQSLPGEDVLSDRARVLSTV